MSWRTTRSAMSSNSVGSRLMMTSRAPLRFAIKGNPAAGQTTSEEPIARNRSQDCARSWARCIAASGIAWPNETVAVLMKPPQAGQSGAQPFAGLHPLAHPDKLVALAAIEAQSEGRVAVQFDDMFRRDARGLMQIVDVLRDDRRHLAGAIEAGERPMAPARLGVAELVVHGEAPPPGFVARLLARQELVERDRPVLGP